MPPTQSESSTKSNFFASLPSSTVHPTIVDVPEGKVQHDKETVIIFDWDDTLLASSFLSSKGYRLDTQTPIAPEILAGLKELEVSVIAALQLALSYGQVCIVTNAETGWVQLSAAKFIPAVVPWLSRLTVISARSTYENMFPESPLKWKFYAMQNQIAPVFAESKKEKNILSFGDSHVEREAVRAVTRGILNTKTKSVKFAERPSLEQLRRQIELVTNCFQYIHNHDGDLDLQLTVTVNNGNAASSQPPTPPLGTVPENKFQSVATPEQKLLA
jgi:hypothetical protein